MVIDVKDKELQKHIKYLTFGTTENRFSKNIFAMKIELEANQYMEMLKAFTEYASCKAECYMLKSENEKLKHEVSMLKVYSHHMGNNEKGENKKPFFLNFCKN